VISNFGGDFVSSALKRGLGYHASPKGLDASFKTRDLAEPVLQDTDKKMI
jgi:hypothetical protein